MVKKYTFFISPHLPVCRVFANLYLMKKIKAYAPYLILFICSVLLVIRAFFGFCSSDEPFYLSTTKRLFEMDRIFVDEWFPTQLSSLILLPFYALYVTIRGNTDGIILFFRLLYVLVTFVLSCVSFRIISKRNGVMTGLAVSLFMLFFAHLNIATLSYYTMSFEFFVFAFILFMLQKRSAYVTGGFFFALSVLSLPSLAIAYVAAFIIILLLSVRFKSLRDGLLWSTVGIMIAGLLFISYLYMSGNSIAGLLKNLPYVLSDDEHQTSLVAPFKKFFTSISDVYGKIFYLNFVLALLGLVSNKFKKLVPYIFTLDCILFVYYAIMSLGRTGYMNTALALFAAPLFFMCKKKDYYSFISLFIGGLIFSMTYSYSSNGELYVLSIGHGIACIAGILFISDFIKENNVLIKYVCAAFVGIFLLQTAALRFINVYRDAPLNRLDTKIAEGPAAGLYTTKEHYDIYSSLLNDIREYADEDGYVLFSKLLPWGYLATDMRCAAPTTWRNKINSERLAQYYELYEYRVPDVVFVLDADVGSYDTCGDIEADPAPNENEWGGALAQYLDPDLFREVRTEHATIYH